MSNNVGSVTFPTSESPNSISQEMTTTLDIVNAPASVDTLDSSQSRAQKIAIDNARIMCSIKELVMTEGLGRIQGTNAISTHIQHALLEFLQELQKESKWQINRICPTFTESNLLACWQTNGVMDLSAYTVVPVSHAASTNNENVSIVDNNPVDILNDDSDDEMRTYMMDITWPTSSPVMPCAEQHSNIQDNIYNEEIRKPWEIHQSNEMEEQDYKWKSVYNAILELTEEHVIFKFKRMPALLRIIWDAYWECIEHPTPASTRFAIYVQIKMEVENADRAPSLTKLQHMVDAMGKVDMLSMYSNHATLLYGLGAQGLLARMVPSDRLQDFYNGRLFDEWVDRIQ